MMSCSGNYNIMHTGYLLFLLLMNYGDSNYLNPALASFWMWSLTLFSIAMVGLATTGHASPDTGPEHLFAMF